MGKLKNRLDKQLEMPEYADDAKDCLIIFNYLMEVDKGHIWESRWSPLVRALCIGVYPNTITVYRPTDLGQKVINSLKSNKAKEEETMTREEEKLKAKDDNAQLALEFTKEFNKCIEKQVPKETAVLAVLHDLADWKDQHPRKGLWDGEKVIAWLKENIGEYYMTNEFEEYFDCMYEDLRKAMEE